MNLIDIIKNAGIVGAGGAGFPTHVKMNAKVDTILVNGAECEPLLCKDKEMMKNYPDEVVGGLLLAVANTSAARGIIALKGKNKAAIEKFNDVIAANKLEDTIKINVLGDYYPSGDEVVMVNDVLGRVVPPGGIPLEVGVIVSNVETFYNIFMAYKTSAPVTDKFLTIAGEVERPVTLKVPVGVKISDILGYAGKVLVDDPVFLSGGAMMSEVVYDPETPVTKTSSGYIVLSKNHRFVQRKTQKPQQFRKVGKSACDQCSYCTEFCPRYLVGHQIEPHRVMRTLLMSSPDEPLVTKWAANCVECGLCGFYSCPEDLLPNFMCATAKRDAAGAQVKFDVKKDFIKAHPMAQYRKVPTKKLIAKIGLSGYSDHADLDLIEIRPKSVTIKLRQHIGQPAAPVVAAGDAVKKGQLIAATPENKLGANIHASIDGTVASVTGDAIIINNINRGN
jgi:Na+-translocating ferredoxin:NAD+ oxidoreductase RnfC subunit